MISMAITHGTDAQREFKDLVPEKEADHAADLANEKMQYENKSKGRAKLEAAEQAREHDRATDHII